MLLRGELVVGLQGDARDCTCFVRYQSCRGQQFAGTKTNTVARPYNIDEGHPETLFQQCNGTASRAGISGAWQASASRSRRTMRELENSRCVTLHLHTALPVGLLSIVTRAA